MASRPSSDALIGSVLAGRFRIISRLGQGGMGVTYRAWDKERGRPVVVKMPKAEFLLLPGFRARFDREIANMRALAHPHIVEILATGEHEGVPFIVMVFLPGGSLSHRRPRDEAGRPRPMHPSTLHLWLPQIAAALDAVHAVGIVHRDVKPANIFFDGFWNAYLGDFGVSKVVDDSGGRDRDLTLTAANTAVGTQQYMAPELFEKNDVDGSTDQWALAVTVYEILAGHRPFSGKTTNLIVEIATHPAPPLSQQQADLPASLCQAVERALSKRPDDRHPTCAAFAAAALEDVPVMADEADVVRLLCPKCATILKLPMSAAGQTGKCPRCRKTLIVADDLSALWRRREQSVLETVSEEDDEEDDETAVIFSPVSASTPVPKRRRKQDMTPAIVAGAISLVVLALVLLARVPKPSPSPAPPPPRPSPSSWKPPSDASWPEQVAAARKRLDAAEFDPIANTIIARNLLFHENQPRESLAFMGRSDFIAISEAARAENQTRTGVPLDHEALLRDAKRWWTAASNPQESLTADERDRVRKHAADLYLESLPGIVSPAAAATANKWLDDDPSFAGRVGGKRPNGIATAALPPGISLDRPVSFQSHNFRNRHLAPRAADGVVVMDADAARRFAFRLVRGLADPAKVSIESTATPGHFMVIEGPRLAVRPNPGTAQFKSLATFEIVAGLADAAWVSFRTHAAPERYLRHSGFVMRANTGTDQLFREDATFRLAHE